MANIRSKRTVGCVGLLLILQGSVASLAVASGATLETKIVPGSELILVDASLTARSGRFIRSDDGMLLLKTFDSGKGRYQEEQFDLQRFSELRVVDRHRSAAYPIIGGLILGGFLAVAGYTTADDGSVHGDVDGEDQRPSAALALGLAGFSIGFVTGAMIAPETRSEAVIWRNN